MAGVDRDYVDDVLVLDCTVGLLARAVLLLLANKANQDTGKTYGGEWLTKRLGRHAGNIARAIVELETVGYIDVDHRRGRAPIVWFPREIYPQVRAQVRELDDTNTRTERAPVREGRAPVRDRSRTSARVSGSLSGSLSAPPAPSNGCRLCDGTSFISEAVLVGDETVWESTPCACHPKRRKRAR